MRKFRFLYILVFIIFIMGTLAYGNNPFTYDLKHKTEYYSKKKVDPLTGFPHFPKEFKVKKEVCTAFEICYKVYSYGKRIEREDHIVNKYVVNHYEYTYEKDKIVMQKFFDNGMLIFVKKYSYNPSGKVKKIEQYDKTQENPFGDWVYFDDSGQLEKIERYRDNKLSYMEHYENGVISETKYFKGADTFITKYNKSGQVLFEKKHNEFEEQKITTINKSSPLVSFRFEDVNLVEIVNGLSQLTLKLKEDNWVVFTTRFRVEGKNYIIDKQSNIYETDLGQTLNFLKDIRRLKAFKLVHSKKLNKKDYGITQSRKKIIIKTKYNKKFEITIGSYYETHSAYYVDSSILNNNLGMVSSERIKYILNKNVNSFRRKQFIGLKTEEIQSFQFDSLKFNKEKGDWINQGSKKNDKKQSTVIIETIIKLRAIEFIDDENSKTEIMGKAQKIHQVILTTKDTEIKIDIFKTENQTYALLSTSNTLYKVPAYVIFFLEKKKKYFE